jgi:DNA polymerase III delta prime subunit
MSKINETLQNISNAFEPNLKATSNYYTDCQDARGGGVLAKQVQKRLEAKKFEHLRFLFTGHLGCGKSSELLHLANSLEKETTYFPVYIDFEKYLDKQDVSLEDIFLGMFTEIAYACREKFELKSRNESYTLIKSVFGFLKDASAKIEFGLPYDIAKVNVEKLRQNPSLRKQVRDAITSNVKRSLAGELNDFITEIELSLRQNTEFTNLIIIADSLEKVKKFEGEKDEIESQTKLFIRHAEQLCGVVTHVVYTIPLSLYRSNLGPQLPQLYGKNVFVLPMVKIHKRGNFDELYQIGIDELKEIITKRLKHSGTNIEKAFTDDALAHIIKYSGGNIRNLIRFIQEASFATDELPINFQAAREAVREEVRGFAASVREEYFEKLAKLELSKDQQINNSDEDYAKMLESTAVLEYLNGNETETDDDYWYAVNPSIRRTNKFNSALERLKTST